MKIFIVIPDYDYDGYGEPEAAYSNRESAEEAVKKNAKGSAPREIIELELDQ